MVRWHCDGAWTLQPSLVAAWTSCRQTLGRRCSLDLLVFCGVAVSGAWRSKSEDKRQLITLYRTALPDWAIPDQDNTGTRYLIIIKSRGARPVCAFFCTGNRNAAARFPFLLVKLNSTDVYIKPYFTLACQGARGVGAGKRIHEAGRQSQKPDNSVR